MQKLCKIHFVSCVDAVNTILGCYRDLSLLVLVPFPRFFFNNEEELDKYMKDGIAYFIKNDECLSSLDISEISRVRVEHNKICGDISLSYYHKCLFLYQYQAIFFRTSSIGMYETSYEYVTSGIVKLHLVNLYDV